MAYFEIGDVLFRGQLNGATGVAKFKLTANAINAVDTVNIGNDQVTYSKYIRYTTTTGSIVGQLPIDIPDEYGWVEIVACGTNTSAVTINGNDQINRNRRRTVDFLMPAVVLVKLDNGPHTIGLRRSNAGTSTGYVLCRYIRGTGV